MRGEPLLKFLRYNLYASYITRLDNRYPFTPHGV